MAAILGGSGVALGAFGAHGLESSVPGDLLAVFETGVRYHLVHALAVLGVGLGADRVRPGWGAAAGWCFVAGVAVFSGSLYAMTLTGARWLGAITPLGGLAFLAGWTALAVAGTRAR